MQLLEHIVEHAVKPSSLEHMFAIECYGLAQGVTAAIKSHEVARRCRGAAWPHADCR